MQPTLDPLDLALIGLYLLFALGVGSLRFRQAGRSAESFFVGDRRLSWWVAGTSIVATTFAADTPLAVTGIVAADGISGNWIWWCWAVAHLTATFFFARMWQRSGVITDAEIVELRYHGRAAAVLRGVKAIYFGLFINCLTMAWVIAAMVKISRAFFEVRPGWVIAACVLVSVTYTLLGGFRSVVVTDLVQFTLGMGGAILLAILVVHQMGGIGSQRSDSEAGSGLLGAVEAAVEAGGARTLEDVLDFVPPRDHPTLPPIYFAVLLTIGWWRYAEGSGYIVQRLAACRSEAHAQGASLWFAVAHNALRPWPWILVGLAALVTYPQLPGTAAAEATARLATTDGHERLIRATPTALDVATGGRLRFEGLPRGCRVTVQGQEVSLVNDRGAQVADFGRFEESGTYEAAVDCPGGTARLPGIRVELHDREMAYPLLIGRTLPHGLLGLVVASLLAAFMSTIDTHTNWGASYLTQDLYRRFLVPSADPRHYVAVSRAFVVLMAVLAGLSALFIHNIAAVWRFLLTLGAGLGSISALRWYWPRVTAFAEFAALGVTTLLAVAFELFGTRTLFGGPNPFFFFELLAWEKILLVAGGSLAAWVPTALLGPSNDEATLRRFARLVRPPGPGWRRYRESPSEPLLPALARFAAGLVLVFSALFGIGDLLIGRGLRGALLVAMAIALLLLVVRSGGVEASVARPQSGK